MTEEQFINLKAVSYLYFVRIQIWRNITKFIYILIGKWKLFMADGVVKEKPIFSRKQASKVVQLTENGKKQSAEELLNVYGNDILRLSYSYLQNMQDSEDILQETLIRYIQKAPAFYSISQQKAWLFRVAINLCKDKLRYKKSRGADELKEMLTEEREDLSFVWDAVKSLPVKYREAIHLFYYEGYSIKEISSILKRKENTVRSDLRRGRQQLKNILKEDYDFE